MRAEKELDDLRLSLKKEKQLFEDMNEVIINYNVGICMTYRLLGIVTKKNSPERNGSGN